MVVGVSSGGGAWGPIMSLQHRCLSFDCWLGRYYSGAEICLSENTLEGFDHCGVCFPEVFEGCRWM